MSQLEPNDFEERWRKAFAEASESPSDELWDRIEQKLPPEQPIGLPLFWIGTVLLFLIGTLGWWYYQSKNSAVPENRPELAQSVLKKERIRSISENKTPTASQETIVAAPAPSAAISASVPSSSQPARKSGKTWNKSGLNKEALAVQNSPKEQTQSIHRQPETRQSNVKNTYVPGSSIPSIQSTVSVPSVANSSTFPVAEEQKTVDLKEAFIKSWTLYPFGKKLNSPAVAVAPVISVKPKSSFPLSKHWISFNASWANFNPAVSTSGGYTSAFYSYAPAYSGQSLPAAAQPQTDTYRGKSHFSYLLELTGGSRLSKHWYLETGVQYLKGHSILNNNIILTSSNSRNSLYNQILESQRSSGPGVKDYAPVGGNNTPNNLSSVSVGTINRFRYSFDFLSVPVSIGYTFRPEKRLNYFASAGLTMDFFLKNVLIDDTYEDIPPAEYGPKDRVYRNITTSTQGAIGANYRLSPKTSLNLKAFARKSLMGGIRHGEYMQIRPLTMGIGLGIRRDL